MGRHAHPLVQERAGPSGAGGGTLGGDGEARLSPAGRRRGFLWRSRVSKTAPGPATEMARDGPDDRHPTTRT